MHWEVWAEVMYALTKNGSDCVHTSDLRKSVKDPITRPTCPARARRSHPRGLKPPLIAIARQSDAAGLCRLADPVHVS